MARIRNIKPEFFRHEALQDLEAANPGAYVMLTYVALWCQCDANGNFAWKPRTLKLDILPFIQFDLEATMNILAIAGNITRYTDHTGTPYGHIPTFKVHQRLSGKEASYGEKHPKPNGEKPGSTREAPGKHPDSQEEGEERSMDNREREGHNAHAHEGQPEIKKTATAQNNAEPTTPPQPSIGAGGTVTDPYIHCIHLINQWARADNWQPLRAYAESVGYQPDQYGPVADEVKKFTTYWLDTRRNPNDRAAFQADPAHFFQEKGRKWLLDAKNMNKQPKNATKKTQYEPPPQHHRSAHRTNGNAHETHISDLIGKKFTKVT